MNYKLVFPIFLFLLLLLPFIIGWYAFTFLRRQKSALKFSRASLLKKLTTGKRDYKIHIPLLFNLLIIILLIITVSRPQGVTVVPNDNLAVVLVIDVSGSMQAKDFDPSRFEAAKEAAKKFVREAKSKYKIGVVTFANFTNVVIGLTEDHETVLKAIDTINYPFGGTAIGEGLITAVGLLNSAGATNKIIVLLSDGESNIGTRPQIAAQYVQQAKVTVYTVGIGTPEGTNIVIGGQVLRVRLDEATLKEIAKVTGGEYFWAKTGKSLEDIYTRLSKKITYSKKYDDVGHCFAGLALFIFLIKLFIEYTFLRTYP